MKGVKIVAEHTAIGEYDVICDLVPRVNPIGVGMVAIRRGGLLLNCKIHKIFIFNTKTSITNEKIFY